MHAGRAECDGREEQARHTHKQKKTIQQQLAGRGRGRRSTRLLDELAEAVDHLLVQLCHVRLDALLAISGVLRTQATQATATGTLARENIQDKGRGMGACRPVSQGGKGSQDKG